MALIWLHERKRGNGEWWKVTLTRSHTRLRPALREQGSSLWGYKGEDKYLVRRWHGEAGKFRLLVQYRPSMTLDERSMWNSPDHLAKSRQFL